MKKDKIFIALIIGLLCLNAKCSNKEQPTPPNPPAATNDISVWITKGDRSALLQKQTTCHLLQQQIQIQQWKWTVL
jgi:hypothetical protein